MNVLPALLAVALLARVALVLFGAYVDAHSPLVPYTDVDYSVLSAAAQCLSAGPAWPECSASQSPFAAVRELLGDPYAHPTYRYSPVLALLLVPTTFVASYGKLLFIASDLLVGILLLALPGTTVTSVVAAWLLNPFVASISTRGSADTLVLLFVVAALQQLLACKLTASAVAFGVAVHLKIYPIIYVPAVLLHLASPPVEGWALLRPNREQVRFGLVSGGTFFALGAAMYALFGPPFIEHTYLYHLTRLDHRHNFSPYFYPLYLSSSPTAPPSTLKMAAFVPQLSATTLLGVAFGRRAIAFAWLVQTIAFVAWNKVVTSQYFLWYIALIPPALPFIRMKASTATILVLSWVIGQAIWLSQAYRLEMLRQPVYRQVWAAGLVWFASNIAVLCGLLASYQLPLAGPEKAQEPRAEEAKNVRDRGSSMKED